MARQGGQATWSLPRPGKSALPLVIRRRLRGGMFRQQTIAGTGGGQHADGQAGRTGDVVPSTAGKVRAAPRNPPPLA
ncbi:hypothetical protein CPT12_28315, partial [Klebsiella pneumoniae]